MCLGVEARWPFWNHGRTGPSGTTYAYMIPTRRRDLSFPSNRIPSSCQLENLPQPSATIRNGPKPACARFHRLQLIWLSSNPPVPSTNLNCDETGRPSVHNRQHQPGTLPDAGPGPVYAEAPGSHDFKKEECNASVVGVCVQTAEEELVAECARSADPHTD